MGDINVERLNRDLEETEQGILEEELLTYETNIRLSVPASRITNTTAI